jgi:ACS family hexuronate transporter-like MFS transporter
LHRVFHLPVSEFGLPLAAIFALAGTGSLVGGYMSGRLIAAGFSLNAGRKLTMLGCACLMLPIYTVTMVDNYWLAVLILGIGLAGHQGFSVSIFSLTADMVPNSRVATVISIGALCGNLAGMGILRLAGYWIGEGYGFAPFLILASVSYFLALGWLQLLVPKIREHA